MCTTIAGHFLKQFKNGVTHPSSSLFSLERSGHGLERHKLEDGELAHSLPGPLRNPTTTTHPAIGESDGSHSMKHPTAILWLFR